VVCLIIGKPGTGKTKMAAEIQSKLNQPSVILDSHYLRQETGNYNFTQEGIHRHLVTLATYARAIHKAGVVPIIVCVAPTDFIRRYFESLFGEDLILVHRRGGYLWTVSKYEEFEEEGGGA